MSDDLLNLQKICLMVDASDITVGGALQQLADGPDRTASNFVLF